MAESSQIKKQKPILPVNVEMLINLSLSECLDQILYIADHIGDKSVNVFIEHLMMSLQELSYWAGGRSSKWQVKNSQNVGGNKYFKAVSGSATISRMTKVCDIRDAICHRGSPNSLLNPGMRVIGGLNFRQGDVEIQYGQIKLMLVGDAIQLYEDLRNFFIALPSLSSWSQSPYWSMQPAKIQLAREQIRNFDFAEAIREKMRRLGLTE